jgi:GNAT superfamily N-acetyltransferase
VFATTLQIDELRIPATVDAPEAADFNEMVAVRNAIEAAMVGSDALACTPSELLPVYRQQAFDPKRIFVARIDGRIVGRAVLSWSIAQGTTSSWILAEVLDGFRCRGIGSALYRTVEELAISSGRPTLQAEVMHTTSPGGQRIPSPTGFGDLPADDPGARFLTRRGYRLEQIERASFLDLPIDLAAASAALREAGSVAGQEYSLVRWTGRTPPHWVSDVATLRTRMSTDAPFAGLDMDEEPWDAARVANADEASAASGGSRLTVAVLHSTTNRLVGFSELDVPDDRTRPAHQGDTLVLSEHRGHRLGMLMKLANLLALHELTRLPPMVCTFNAEENRHMLDVNEAIGFRAFGSAACWRKHD